MVARILACVTAVAVSYAAGPAAAALIAYDGFDYTAGALGGQNGGTGWIGAWSNPAAGGATVNSAGMTYGHLPVVGGKAYVAPVTTNSSTATYAQRQFTTAGAPINSGQLYISALLEKDVNGSRFFVLQLLNGGTEVGWFGHATGQTTWHVNGFGGSASTGVGIGTDPVFMVYRLDFDNSTASLWLNPILGESGPLSAPNATYSLGTGSYQVTGLGIGAGQTNTTGAPNYSSGWFDEIRIGTTWADVTPAPEPSTWALLGLGVACLWPLRRLRRRAA